MRKLIVAGAAGLLAVTALAGTANAQPNMGYPYGPYGYGRPYGYGYGYGRGPSVRFTVPVPPVVSPYPYGYYRPGYYPPSYYYGPRYRAYPRPYYGNPWRY